MVVGAVVQSVVSGSLRPHGLQHVRLPCPLPSPGACSNSCPLSQWCHSTISSSVIPFFACLQSFPASGSFLKSQLFQTSGQSIGASASASVLPVNIQGWFLRGLTGMIPLLSKGLSKVIFLHHSLKASVLWLSLFYGPTLTSTHGYWKNHSFVYIDCCQQSDISAF